MLRIPTGRPMWTGRLFPSHLLRQGHFVPGRGGMVIKKVFGELSGDFFMGMLIFTHR